MAAMPFGMKVLSPQLSTCLPRRRSTAASPISNGAVTYASSSPISLPTRSFASSLSPVRSRSPSRFSKSMKPVVRTNAPNPPAWMSRSVVNLETLLTIPRS